MSCVTSICDERFNLIKALFPEGTPRKQNLNKIKLCVCDHFLCKHDIRQAELRNIQDCFVKISDSTCQNSNLRVKKWKLWILGNFDMRVKNGHFRTLLTFSPDHPVLFPREKAAKSINKSRNHNGYFRSLSKQEINQKLFQNLKKMIADLRSWQKRTVSPDFNLYFEEDGVEVVWG